MRRCLKRGFTLMEVLVASVVLSVGVAGIGHSVGCFLQMKDRESKKGIALMEAVELMESQVADVRPCADSKDSGTAEIVSRQGVDFSLDFERLPGGAPLQWVFVREISGYWSDLTLKRIVRCVEKVSH